MTRRALVIGGTGPTGVHIVRFMAEGGFEVAVFTSGKHDSGANLPAGVEHLYGDARDPGDIARCVAERRWDVAICTYGRLRLQAGLLAGHCGRLVGITGQPVYAGAARPMPEGGIALPVPEWAPRQNDGAGYTAKIAEGEDQLFEQHGRGDFEAVVVRYPGVYGPRAPINHEWAVVKRILDQRSFMLLPHDGASYFQRGYSENVAWLVYLAATRPEAAGQAFNAGDERVLSARMVAELIINELGSPMRLVGVPAQFVRGVFPLAEKAPLMLDMSKARNLLGYRDRVDVEAATRLTARWLHDNPPAEGEITGAAGAFDYATDERVAAAWERAVAVMNEGAGRGV